MIARALLMLLFIALSVGGAQAAPTRVVSLSLCTDQFVLALAERGQVAALSRLAGDPHLSPFAAQAAGMPRHGGTAEEILMLKPDLVVAGGFARGRTVEMLEQLGVPVLRLRSATLLADILPQVEQVAQALGRMDVASEAGYGDRSHLRLGHAVLEGDGCRQSAEPDCSGARPEGVNFSRHPRSPACG